jgi:hypothetical protein
VGSAYFTAYGIAPRQAGSLDKLRSRSRAMRAVYFRPAFFRWHASCTVVSFSGLVFCRYVWIRRTLLPTLSRKVSIIADDPADPFARVRAPHRQPQTDQ